MFLQSANQPISQLIKLSSSTFQNNLNQIPVVHFLISSIAYCVFMCLVFLHITNNIFVALLFIMLNQGVNLLVWSLLYNVGTLFF